MRQLFLTFCYFLLLFCNFSCQIRHPEYSQDVIDNQNYLRKWLLCGPFPLEVHFQKQTQTVANDSFAQGFEVDFLQSSEGELKTLPAEGTIALLPDLDLKRRWFFHENETDDILHFDEIFGLNKNFIAYAFCQINCDNSQEAMLSIDCNSRFKLFHNEKFIFELPVNTLKDPQVYQIPLNLKHGENDLLLKLEFATGDLGLLVKFINKEPQG